MQVPRAGASRTTVSGRDAFAGAPWFDAHTHIGQNDPDERRATPAEILAYAADDPMSVAARPPLARSTTDEFGRFLLTVSGTPVVLLVRSPTGGAGAVLTPPLEL